MCSFKGVVLREFGLSPLSDVRWEKKRDTFISAVSKLLSDLKPFQLVNLTHRKGTAWESVYVPGAKNIYISEDAMQQEYSDVWKKKE